jgi:hypothetical protein
MAIVSVGTQVAAAFGAVSLFAGSGVAQTAEGLRLSLTTLGS